MGRVARYLERLTLIRAIENNPFVLESQRGDDDARPLLSVTLFQLIEHFGVRTREPPDAGGCCYSLEARESRKATMRQEGGHETTFVSRCKHAEDKFFSPNRAPARQLNCRGELGIPTAVTIWAFLIGSQFCQISSPHNLLMSCAAGTVLPHSDYK